MSTPRERLAIFGIVIFFILGSFIIQSDDELKILGIVFYGGAAAVWRFMLNGRHESHEAEGADNAR